MRRPDRASLLRLCSATAAFADDPGGADAVRLARELGWRVNTGRCRGSDAHNIECDAHFLRHIKTLPSRYLGLLGPAAGRNRLLEMAGPDAAAFGGRPHARLAWISVAPYRNRSRYH